VIQSRSVSAQTNEFVVLEAGGGPLALCLHGFPDSAHTWRHLLPALAQAGFHAVAPFMRGYAPTAIPADGCFTTGALVADAIALHEALGGDERAVLIGHDWGAEAAYGAAAFAPDRFRRLVTLAIPPAALDLRLFSDHRQLKRFWYFFLFQTPLAETVVGADEMAFIDRLWQDWSPGYDAREDLKPVKECLRDQDNLKAAIGYYRAALGAGHLDVDGRYAAEQEAVRQLAPQPTLYLHGDQDGCVGIELVGDVEQHLAPGSLKVVVAGAGHFLHLEQPEVVREQIVAWVAGT
jgi:pimeloyl-ACP methyl ester carboxylesterase